jgi:predicted unusual protein kinase regulating ubiquinone biosynthesis (AarF/ABC1/UbiB family)
MAQSRAMKEESEQNQFGKRVRRYAHVTKAAIKVGAVGAARRLGGEATALSPALIRDALGGLKGPLMKIAQILGTIPDLVPADYASAMAELQADAPPMGPPFVRRRMAAELGKNWEKRFAAFEMAPAAAASLGQVHRATALDGAALACKLQYPDMASVVEADIRQMKLALGLYERLDRSVRTGDVQAEIAERLREELDYGREARNTALFQTMLADTSNVVVPTVYPDLSTNRLLTLSWLEGRKLTRLLAEDPSQATRDALARLLFQAWYRPFYAYGVLHGDPHLGNYSVAPDGRLNLMDFGCIRVFEPTLVEAVLILFHALDEGRDAATEEAYVRFGFAQPSRALVTTLNQWSRFIFAPLLENRARLIEETNTGLYGRAMANKMHAELRQLGGVDVPRAFVFLDRAAVGLGSVFLRLRACLNWRTLFDEAAALFELGATTRRQSDALEKNRLFSRMPENTLHIVS